MAPVALGNVVTERDLLQSARQALLTELNRAPAQGSVQARAEQVEPQADRQTLMAFFSARDPDKLAYVEEILQKFNGREPTMYEHLITQYRIKRTNRYRDEIIKYYERHNPARICAVDVILDLYEGREDQLMFLLVNKYQPDSPLRVWCRYIDSGTGREYFHNRITQEVQWAVPTRGYLIESGRDFLIPLEEYVGATSVLRDDGRGPPVPPRAPSPSPQTQQSTRSHGHAPASPPRATTMAIIAASEAAGSGSPEMVHVHVHPGCEGVLHPKQPPPTNTAYRGVPSASASVSPGERRYRASSSPHARVAVQYEPLGGSVPPAGAAAAAGVAMPLKEDMCVCEVCNLVCSGFEDLAIHKEQADHGAWYPCGVGGCPFQFPSNHSLLLHRLQIHAEGGGAAQSGSV